MAEIRGSIHAFYLFDIADAIDLAAIRARLGAAAATPALSDKSPGPTRLRYVQPPVIATGAALGVPELDGAPLRVKFFDYGVASLSVARDFSGTWSDLVAEGHQVVDSDHLPQQAQEACRRIVEAVAPALTGRRRELLDEDYVVFAMTEAAGAPDADALIAGHGREIAQLLRGEQQPLSRQEREDLLRYRLSYFDDDLVIPAWSAAFVYDRGPAITGALELLEFANSQLLEFRYYDDLLDRQVGRIYGELQRPRWTDRIAGRRRVRAALELHSLFIDVSELTDRTENALKLVGDVYAARLFALVATRLGLDAWKHNVEDKLETLNDIYRFAVEQTGMSQANILELAIVLILVIELGLLLAGLIE